MAKTGCPVKKQSGPGKRKRRKKEQRAAFIERPKAKKGFNPNGREPIKEKRSAWGERSRGVSPRR